MDPNIIKDLSCNEDIKRVLLEHEFPTPENVAITTDILTKKQCNEDWFMAFWEMVTTSNGIIITEKRSTKWLDLSFDKFKRRMFFDFTKGFKENIDYQYYPNLNTYLIKNTECLKRILRKRNKLLSHHLVNVERLHLKWKDIIIAQKDYDMIKMVRTQISLLTKIENETIRCSYYQDYIDSYITERKPNIKNTLLSLFKTS